MNLTRLVGILAFVVGVSLLLTEPLLGRELFMALTGTEPESVRLASIIAIVIGLLAIKFGG